MNRMTTNGRCRKKVETRLEHKVNKVSSRANSRLDGTYKRQEARTNRTSTVVRKNPRLSSNVSSRRKRVFKSKSSQVKLKRARAFLALVVCFFIMFTMNRNDIMAYFTDIKSITNIFSINAQYTITFDSNTGTGTMPNQTISYNVATYISQNSFTKMGYVFSGWNTAPNGSGTSYTSYQSVVNLGDITLYAQWKLAPVKYAVQIYGINQDEDENGNPIGLTFGPAVGDDYNNKYVTHYYQETYDGSGEYYVVVQTTTVEVSGTQSVTSEYLKDSNGNYVIRTEEEVEFYDVGLDYMNWEDIANVTDKTRFLDCMLCGDTKSVKLTLDDTIRSNYVFEQRGDGTSMLYDTINDYYRKWNPNQSDNSYVGTGVTLDSNEENYGSNARNAGGYSSSHIRATLVGEDSKTNEGYAGDENLNTSNSLYNAIESDLRNIITAKKIKYVTGTNYTSGNYSLNDDIFDKIWLFSNRELYGTGDYSGLTTEGINIAGDGYEKFGNNKSRYYMSSYNNNNNINRVGYTETGSNYSWWLRSPYLDTTYGSYFVGGSGYSNYYYGTYSRCGINFGFCLQGEYTVTFEDYGWTGIMISQTISNNVPTKLTPNTFIKDGYKFVGWNTEPDGSGTSYEPEEEVLNLGDITLYPQWEELPFKYAVQIYGINQDVDSSGNPLGLTFGPATGDNYNNKYITHEYEETFVGSGIYNVVIVTHDVEPTGNETISREYLENSSGNNVTRILAEKNKYDVNLHNMTWTEIANTTDKTIFTDCMLCGDTKAVELALNDTITSNGEYYQYGDGTGSLYGSINSYYNIWNPSYNSTITSRNNSAAINGGNSGSNARNAGGYSSSHIRATLIGSNIKTDITYAGDINLGSDTCLYSCLENDLKSAISSKKVKYVTGISRSNYTVNDDIADKIWLFSNREMYATGLETGFAEEGLGTAENGYDKFRNTESKYYMSSYSCDATENRIFYDENDSSSILVALRTIDVEYNSTIDALYGYTGATDISYCEASEYIGISFGFCLQGNYQVAFDSNGGTGTMGNQTISNNVPTELSTNTFTRAGYVFSGWNTGMYGTGTSYSDEAEVTNLGNVTLYAQWTKAPTKYAVQIYGINQDEDENGNPLGLTFGPAVGDNYNNKYVTHDYEEITGNPGNYYVKIITHTVAADNSETISSEYLYEDGGTTTKVTRTTAEKNKYDINMHELTWTEIANVTDKTAFLDCMLCGDTKTVNLTLNSTIGTENVYNQYGDGAGMLAGSIRDYYRKWNPSPSDNSYVGTGVTFDINEQSNGSNARNAGGYSASHIRATLIGENNKTNKGYAGDVNLSSSNSLYSCIEDDLKNVIIAKRVKYVTGTSSSNYNLNNDIEDKIWLFSNRELYGTGNNYGLTTEGIGLAGVGYDKFGSNESKYYISSYNDNGTINKVAYNESSYKSLWWLRSPYIENGFNANAVGNGGHMSGYDRVYIYGAGISFGFCLQGEYSVNFNANGGTGTMSNQTVSNNVSTGLNINTFTRPGYIFAGWNTKADGSGTSYSDEDDVTNLGNVTLYAQWERVYERKYAVQIYGINQDEDENGNPLGLTFGPATGEDYNHKYVTHTYEETSQGSGEYYVLIVTHTVAADKSETISTEYLYKSGGTTTKVTRTLAEKNKYDVNIHDMTWAEIANVTDKTKFLDCMLCGDTKSVKMNLNMTIGEDWGTESYGDGIEVLYLMIKDYYRKWNPGKNENSAAINSESAGTNAKTAGGYSSSHIRATLIGENSDTDITYAGDVNLNSTNCLYSCIEKDLRNVIVAKKVEYVTGPSDSNYTSNVLYDKIWLFSNREVCGTGLRSGGNIEGLGTNKVGYDKFRNTESKYYMPSYSEYSTIVRKSFDGSGLNGVSYWIRSPQLNVTDRAYEVDSSGGNSTAYASYGPGISFGFCIR